MTRFFALHYLLPFVIAAVVGLGGLQVFTVGVIGEYIGRVYYESKHRPHYLVKETEEGSVSRQADHSIEHRNAR